MRILGMTMIFWSCVFSDQKADDVLSNMDPKKETAVKIDLYQDYVIDSTAFELFWEEFNKCLKETNIKCYENHLSFPLTGKEIALSYFAFSCDSSDFDEQRDKWDTLRIGKNSLAKYHSIYFNDNMMEILSMLKSSDILNDGELIGNTLVYTKSLADLGFTCGKKLAIVLNINKVSGRFKLSLSICC